MAFDSLSGKVAIVTGGAAGIGAAAAKIMAESGARLTLVDYNQDWLDETGTFIKTQLGQEVLAIKADVSEPGVGDMAVAETLKRYGRLDIDVNIAGINQNCPIIDMTDDDWNRMLNVHLYGTFSFCRASAREMVKQGRGVIVNCSSVRAFSGLADCSHYTAAKGGINGLTYSLAIELGKHGIRVNAVAPAGTATKLSLMLGRTPEQVAASIANPPPTIMTAEQVGRTVAFLASDESDMLNGQVVGVTRYRGDNAGNELAPRDHTRLE